MGMNGGLAGSSSHFDLSGVLDYPTWIKRSLLYEINRIIDSFLL